MQQIRKTTSRQQQSPSPSSIVHGSLHRRVDEQIHVMLHPSCLAGLAHNTLPLVIGQPACRIRASSKHRAPSSLPCCTGLHVKSIFCGKCSALCCISRKTVLSGAPAISWYDDNRSQTSPFKSLLNFVASALLHAPLICFLLSPLARRITFPCNIYEGTALLCATTRQFSFVPHICSSLKLIPLRFFPCGFTNNHSKKAERAPTLSTQRSSEL